LFLALSFLIKEHAQLCVKLLVKICLRYTLINEENFVCNTAIKIYKHFYNKSQEVICFFRNLNIRNM
jgi:hypothetical protein